MSELKDLAFETREQYLEWKAEYKRQYFKLAREIRKAKKHYRSPHRQIVSWSGMTPTWSQGVDGYKAMMQVLMLKAQARDMLELRRVSKLKAGEQWLAARQARQASV